MNNNQIYDVLNPLGAWDNTRLYRAQVLYTQVVPLPAYVSCPLVTYGGSLYFATGFDANGNPLQPTLGLIPSQDPAWLLWNITGGSGGYPTITSPTRTIFVTGTAQNPFLDLPQAIDQTANPSFAGLTLTYNATTQSILKKMLNFLIKTDVDVGVLYTASIRTTTLTGNRTVTIPDANSTTVVPATAQAGKVLAYIGADGIQVFVNNGGGIGSITSTTLTVAGNNANTTIDVPVGKTLVIPTSPTSGKALSNIDAAGNQLETSVLNALNGLVGIVSLIGAGNIVITPNEDNTLTISSTGGGSPIQLLSGITTPDNSLGNNGDLYLYLTTSGKYITFQKVQNVWGTINFFDNASISNTIQLFKQLCFSDLFDVNIYPNYNLIPAVGLILDVATTTTTLNYTNLGIVVITRNVTDTNVGVLQSNFIVGQVVQADGNGAIGTWRFITTSIAFIDTGNNSNTVTIKGHLKTSDTLSLATLNAVTGAVRTDNLWTFTGAGLFTDFYIPLLSGLYLGLDPVTDKITLLSAPTPPNSRFGSTSVVATNFRNYVNQPSPDGYIPTDGDINKFGVGLMPFGVTTNQFSANTGEGLINGVRYIDSQAQQDINRGNGIIFPQNLSPKTNINFKLTINTFKFDCVFTTPLQTGDVLVEFMIANTSVIAALQNPTNQPIAFFNGGVGDENVNWITVPTATVVNTTVDTVTTSTVTVTAGNGYIMGDWNGVDYVGSNDPHYLFVIVSDTSSGTNICTSMRSVVMSPDRSICSYALEMTIDLQGGN